MASLPICSRKNCTKSVCLDNLGQFRKICYGHYRKMMLNKDKKNDYEYCRDIIKKGTVLKDLLPIIEQIPLNAIKSSIIHLVDHTDSSNIHQISFAITPINDLFSIDIIQYLLSFCIFAEIRNVCKQWSQAVLNNIKLLRKNSIDYPANNYYNIGSTAVIVPLSSLESFELIPSVPSVTSIPSVPSVSSVFSIPSSNESGLVHTNEYGPFSSIRLSWCWWYSELDETMRKKYPNHNYEWDESESKIKRFSTFHLYNGLHDAADCGEENTGYLFQGDIREGQIIGMGDNVIIYENPSHEDCCGIYITESSVYFKNIIFDTKTSGYHQFCENAFISMRVKKIAVFYHCTFTHRCGTCPILVREFKQNKNIHIHIIGCIFENNDPKLYHKYKPLKDNDCVHISSSHYSNYPVYLDDFDDFY